MNIDFHSRKNILFLAIGGILIVGVLVAFWAFYLRQTNLYVNLFESQAANAPSLTCHISAQAPAGVSQRVRVLFPLGIADPNNVWMSAKTSANRRVQETVARALPAGTYNVTLESWDYHSVNGGGGQTKEIYKVELRSGSDTVLAETGASTDIPNNRDYHVSTLSQQVIVPDGITVLAPVHAAYPDALHQSLTAVCAAFDLVSVPPSPATLTVIKTVINDNTTNRGTLDASAFQVHVKQNGTDVTNSPAAGSATGTAYTLNAGTYNVSENAQAGFTMIGTTGDCDANGSITLAAGESKTCTITNNDNAPPPPTQATLTVIKLVNNNSGRSAVEGDFNIHVKSGGVDVTNSPAAGSSSGTLYTLPVGTYVVSEDSFPDYAVTGITGDCDARGAITLAAGETKTCTITNDDDPFPPATTATLTVIKTVINNNGKTKLANEFAITVTGTNPSPATFPGAGSPGTTVTLNAGAYSVDEAADPYYTKTLSADCTGTIAAGQTKTCTITNDDNASLLPPSNVRITALPVCSVSGYLATISWTGDPNPVSGNFLVEISDDPNFSAPFSKTVASSPTDSTGFIRGSDTLELLPGTTYYARVSNN